MCTSSGRCFSNAARSGALTDVWPATIAPTFVAEAKFYDQGLYDDTNELTRPVLRHDSVNILSLHGVHDKIRAPRDLMPILEHSDSRIAYNPNPPTSNQLKHHTNARYQRTFIRRFQRLIHLRPIAHMYPSIGVQVSAAGSPSARSQHSPLPPTPRQNLRIHPPHRAHPNQPDRRLLVDRRIRRDIWPNHRVVRPSSSADWTKYMGR